MVEFVLWWFCCCVVVLWCDVKVIEFIIYLGTGHIGGPHERVRIKIALRGNRSN